MLPGYKLKSQEQVNNIIGKYDLIQEYSSQIEDTKKKPDVYKKKWSKNLIEALQEKIDIERSKNSDSESETEAYYNQIMNHVKNDLTKRGLWISEDES
ncbi:MAG: hypothetical protein MK033_02275 [Candidatus Caenarcaniphilales bacterium]|nr:hypothetical protein [Candidatus Caenarcaniphilales bacterium]